jgi:hypothetical protein
MAEHSKIDHYSAPADGSSDESSSSGKDYGDDTKQIIFKDIDEGGKYACGRHGTSEIIIMKSNGYINATKMCRDHNKHYEHWNKSKQSKKIIRELTKNMNTAPNKIIIKVSDGENTLVHGTYVPPMLMVRIAHWISPGSAIEVGLWIEEWKKYNHDIRIKYYKLRESKIKKKLNKKLKGETEVETPNGFIDILTTDKIIEIKECTNWKHALGQILAYSDDYPNHKKIIYLFDVPDDYCIDNVKRTCKKYDVTIKKI